MRKTSVQKHVTLYPSHVDVLDSIIEKNPDINKLLGSHSLFMYEL